jgi:septum formation protein
MTDKQMVLCSASPRRQLLLKELGFQFEVLKKDVDESFPSHLVREQIACYLSEKKAHAFKDQLTQNKIFITADTIVWLDNKALNKPADEREAFSMLKQLSDNMHQVYTGVTLMDSDHTKTFFVKTNVYFNKLEDNDITFYIKDFKPFDKAGSYGAQECLPDNMDPLSNEERIFLKQMGKPNLADSTRHASAGKKLLAIKKIEGSYFNVMGLPIVELYNELKGK